MTDPETPTVAFHPYRWGDPARPGELPVALRAALPALGVTEPESEPPAVEAIPLPEVALPDGAQAAIEAVVGAEHVTSEHVERLTHTRGWSTPDLLKLRSGDATDAPDAVVLPGSHDEVLEVLRVCARERVAVVPYSGGTSVVGGLAPSGAWFAGTVSLDLRRLDRLVDVDPVSRVATLQAGVRGPDAERLLAEHGLTLGHFPQSYEGASIGGYAAARSAGQSSAGYGRFDDMVIGLQLATPRGTISLGTAEKSAAGPDLRQLVLGSEGTLGVITSVTVRVRPRPAEAVYEGWRFTSFAAGVDAVRRVAQDGPSPTVLRLSDEAETGVNLADPANAGAGAETGGAGGCLAIVGYEGTVDDVARRRELVAAVLTDAGGASVGTRPGRAWADGRFRGPYLRDPLLDAGVLVETLETVTLWSNLVPLKQAVTEALTSTLSQWSTPPLVLCHVSHVYETSASLYFTVACAQADDPLAQWAQAKEAATAAIRAGGGSVSHHHGVGTDHRAAYAEEIGPLATEVLRAVKHTVDPAGVLNPGVLIGNG